MEEKKDYRQQNNIQKFYFNDDGQLVIESNKGVWVDGTPYVKMYGNFTCNAKTMGEIIHQLKGVPVEVGELKYVTQEDVDNYGWGIAYIDRLVKSQTRCILGASKERIEEYEKELAKQEFVSKKIEELQKQIGDYGDEICALKKSIGEFNSLPWWKRIFKKIEIK